MGLETVDAAACDPVAAIRDLTAGRGASCVVEAAGLPKTCAQALALAAPRAEIVFMGNLRGTLALPEREFSEILRKELSIHGSWNSRTQPRGSDEWTTSLERMGRGLEVAPLVTHRLPLSEGPRVFEEMRHGRGQFGKVVFLMP
jgi:threonine dehydrogenase-like Zn-dependent dehydrogenase